MQIKPKFAFIDRDGVINRKAEEHQYICRVEDFVFNEGIAELLLRLKNNGYELAVITNQRGIARGLYNEETLQKIHQHMTDTLQSKGAVFRDIFYCPHDKDQCNCRKPHPGMLEQALKKYDFEPEQSMIVSDSVEDITMGVKFGLKEAWFCEVNKPLMYTRFERNKEGSLSEIGKSPEFVEYEKNKDRLHKI